MTSDDHLKPVNHKRTPSFETVLIQMRKQGKDPNEYNITRISPKKFQILKKEDLVPIEVEYLEKSRKSNPRNGRPSSERHPINRRDGEYSDRPEDYGHSSEDRGGWDVSPPRFGKGRDKSKREDASRALEAKRNQRRALASSGTRNRATQRSKPSRTQQRRRDRHRREPKPILRKQEKSRSKRSHNSSSSSEDVDVGRQEEYHSEEYEREGGALKSSMRSARSRREQRREGRRKSRPSSPTSHSEVARPPRRKSRSRSRGAHKKRSDRGVRDIGSAARKGLISEDLGLSSDTYDVEAVKRNPKKLGRRKERVLNEDIARMSHIMQGVRTPEKSHIQEGYNDRGWMTQGHGPAVGGWKGIGDVLDFVDSVYPEGGKKRGSSVANRSQDTSSEGGGRRRGPMEISARSPETRDEDVKELLSEKDSRNVSEERASKLPVLKGLNVIIDEEESAARKRATRASSSVQTERVRVSAPKTSGRKDIVPFAYTKVFTDMTTYPRLVGTGLIIPQKGRTYKGKIKDAINAVDMIVEEYQQSYKQMNMKGELMDMEAPDCIRKVLCFPNLAKNHTIEPPAGFGIVMDSNKNVPIKTTPFNPTKFFYGTVAFRIPTDIRIDTPDAIKTFRIRYNDEETGEQRDISILDYIEETPPTYLAESLIPNEAKTYRRSIDEGYGDSEDDESAFDYPISDTPMMDAFLDGRGTYAGLYLSTTRDDDWQKQLWVVVQCNDPKTSQELYDHLRQVQDEGMGIRDEDRGFYFGEEKKQEEEKEKEESSEGTSASSESEKREKPSHVPKVMANWPSAIFNNAQVRQARARMTESRLCVAQELLSAYGVNVTIDNIKKLCYPFIETVTNTFYHDPSSSSYMFAGSGVTIISPDTKAVVIGERPSKGPLILHGPPKSLETRTSAKDDTLSWDLSDAKGVYRLFPCCTGRHRTNTEIREHLKKSSDVQSKIPILDHVVYPGKFEKEVQYYPPRDSEDGIWRSSAKDTKRMKSMRYINPKDGHYHARLTTAAYNTHTVSHVRREQKCGYNRDWPVTQLQPIAVRVGTERERVHLFSF